MPRCSSFRVVYNPLQFQSRKIEVLSRVQKGVQNGLCECGRPESSLFRSIIFEPETLRASECWTIEVGSTKKKVACKAQSNIFVETKRYKFKFIIIIYYYSCVFVDHRVTQRSRLSTFAY